MNKLSLFEKSTFRARALLVGDRLDLRTMEEAESLALTPLTVRVEEGAAVLYRYGAIVFFGVEAVHASAFVERLKVQIGGAHAKREAEEVEIHVVSGGREGMQGNAIFVASADIEHLQIIADVLAKSVVLARYEERLAQTLERIEPLAEELAREGQVGSTAKSLLRNIGTMMLSEYMMVGRVTIPEKPELLWENPALQGFYNRLEDEFEILERHAALERKLNLISRTSQTLLDVLNNRHSMRLEWYIVILIVAELLLTLYEQFVR